MTSNAKSKMSNLTRHVQMAVWSVLCSEHEGLLVDTLFMVPSGPHTCINLHETTQSLDLGPGLERHVLMGGGSRWSGSRIPVDMGSMKKRLFLWKGFALAIAPLPHREPEKCNRFYRLLNLHEQRSKPP